MSRESGEERLTGKDDDEKVNDELRDLQGGQVLLPLFPLA